ncbi:Hypothetical predicted protein [Podarcis lilfordi]|uniref:Uncharacterized protein n=1 Tax=Podarcis lilfordi TaxID=74358 RepID=A0AA35PL12_9SAUR|nr:Hypothetical predicted protein [Podarcis lilfordi]
MVQNAVIQDSPTTPCCFQFWERAFVVALRRLCDLLAKKFPPVPTNCQLILFSVQLQQRHDRQEFNRCSFVKTARASRQHVLKFQSRVELCYVFYHSTLHRISAQVISSSGRRKRRQKLPLFIFPKSCTEP